jgi:hypothetical protein
MWRITLLSILRKMAFPKRRAASNSLSNVSLEEQHRGPMSDQQLAIAIRQFQWSRSKMTTPLPLCSAFRVGKAR